jgi:drug/metabolite transporter (DMT)-like permease
MKGHTLRSAILLLVIGNALAVLSDVVVKLMGGDAPVFQFILLRTLITIALLLPFYRQFDLKTPFAGLRVHLLRSMMALLGIFCMVVALTTLPLATANAVFYIAPLMVMLLAVLMFSEKLTRWSVLAVVSGLGGTLVILRPLEFNWGAVAALGGALALAVNAVLVRLLPQQHSTVHKLFISHVLMVPAAILLFAGEWFIRAPGWRPDILGFALGSGALILIYSLTVLLAYRTVDANQVTSAEYTGLIWAILIGWIWFAEAPDIWFVIGSLMIVVPLVLLGVFQNRPATAHHSDSSHSANSEYASAPPQAVAHHQPTDPAPTHKP